MTAKMQGPHNHGGLSHDGTSYEPDGNGHIEVPEYVIPHAFAHGFHLVTEGADPQSGTPADSPLNFSKLNKNQLLVFAKDNFGLDLDAALTNKELIAQIETALAAKEAGAE